MNVQKIHKRNTVELHKQSLCLKAEPEERPPSASLWSDPPPIPLNPAYGGETKRNFNEGRGIQNPWEISISLKGRNGKDEDHDAREGDRIQQCSLYSKKDR